MEAMSMNLPIVTTSDGSISELVERTVVHPGKVNQLVLALKKTIPLIKKNKSLNNREIIKKKHNPNNILKFKKHLEKIKKK